MTEGPAAAELQRALELARRYLNRRERSVAEMRRHLTARGVDADLLDLAIGELSRLGLLDDARYVKLFIQDRRLLAGYASERIRRDLLARGIARDLIERALRDDDSVDEREHALELLRRRFPRGLMDDGERRRAYGLLVRRGFAAELAGETVRACNAAVIR